MHSHARTLRGFGLCWALACFVLNGASGVGCSNSETSSTSGNTGGIAGSGPAASIGGAQASAGATATGGADPTAAGAGSGGLASGGSSGGGAKATGATAGTGTGSTGGSSTAGGAAATGGAGTVGGASVAGGGTTSGGSSAAGGSAGTTSTVQAPQELMVPPLAFDDTSITLIWSKPDIYSNISSYQIYRDGVLVGSTTKLFFTVTGLVAATSYSFTARATAADGTTSPDSNVVVQVTAATPTVLDVTAPPYQAAGNGTTLDTVAIQRAIDACPGGGKVLLPSGHTFLSGALNLKSNCTFQVDGTLLGSSSAGDYPYTSQRFPYYPVTNYMGLLNAYTTSYGSLTNIRVTGSGTITGSAGNYDANGYTALGNAQIRNGDDTTRGDMITIKGVDGLYFGGVTLRNPAEHTIFLSYSQNVTFAGVTVGTFDIANADGVDIAVSDTVYVFNSTFDTGDDCINLNAGSSAPGVAEGIPTSNIRIFNNSTQRGHGGVAFGSFTAGWIENILVEDCLFDGTNIGLRFKTGADRGGGARNVLARDITMKNILNQAISVDSHYTAGTQFPAASTPGVFQNITIENVVASMANTSCNLATNAGIWLDGLANAPETGVRLSNVTISNGGSGQSCVGTSVDWVTNSTFDRVTLQGFDTAWRIVAADTSDLSFQNCSPAVP